MTVTEFEAEIKKLDLRFSILPSPTRPGLSNIYFDGKNFDLPVVSSNDIKEDIDPMYRYSFPNGMLARFWSRPEIIARLEKFLLDFKGGKISNLYE